MVLKIKEGEVSDPTKLVWNFADEGSRKCDWLFYSNIDPYKSNEEL